MHPGVQYTETVVIPSKEQMKCLHLMFNLVQTLATEASIPRDCVTRVTRDMQLRGVSHQSQKYTPNTCIKSMYPNIFKYTKIYCVTDVMCDMQSRGVTHQS